jgi:glycosyltransferase involved in cell wall biosynthesis
VHRVSRKVLVMIPAYNEEKTVGEIVESTLALYPSFKVVVVDDGSEDTTAQKAREAGADVVSLPFHCGGSIAIQTGYLVATRQDYDCAVKIDADGQHKPEEIPKLLDPLVNDGTDMTVGSRYLTINNGNCSLVKEGGRVFSSTLVSLLRKMEITDITSGMRAWSRKAIETLLPIYLERRYIEDSVFWVVETLLAYRKGLRMKEVPIEVLPRRCGRSKSYSTSKLLVYPLRLITTLLEQVSG